MTFPQSLITNLGKTATTQEVIAAIRKEVEEENLPKFKYVELNGMRMTRPKQAYAAIWSQLTGEKRTADHASELLEEKFESRRMKEPILMLVDELGKLSHIYKSSFSMEYRSIKF